jgi:glyoxylase-like metal-dependent hydrolase (beta-lactamase superfamily II)
MTTQLLDVKHMGQSGLIGVWVVGDILIDCGPSNCVQALLDSLDGWEPKALLLTHIHLDHAGAAGTLVQVWPKLEIFVHERGARHLIAPERLMASAYRVFGSQLDERFGPLTPVPAANVHPLTGGETVFGLAVQATPGHASHHISFFNPDSGYAYPGDIAGVALGEGPVVPPTPPPDIDLPRWRDSLDRLEAWAPTSLGLPHFGQIDDVTGHLSRMRAALDEHEEHAREGEADGYISWFFEELRSAAPERIDDYALLVPPDNNFAGMLQSFAHSSQDG